MDKTPEKFGLRDDSRSAIRWSQNKRGYVLRAIHYDGPRGARYRPNIHFVGTTESGALREVAKYRARAWKPTIRQTELYAVDALGNVLDLVEVL